MEKKHIAIINIKIVYQNMRGSSINGNMFLEWYRELEIDICFIGEAWKKVVEKIQFRIEYEMITEKGKVMTYVKEELGNSIKVKIEKDRIVILEADGKTIARVYAPSGGGKEEFETWLGSWEDIVRGGVLIED